MLFGVSIAYMGFYGTEFFWIMKMGYKKWLLCVNGGSDIYVCYRIEAESLKVKKKMYILLLVFTKGWEKLRTKL